MLYPESRCPKGSLERRPIFEFSDVAKDDRVDELVAVFEWVLDRIQRRE